MYLVYMNRAEIFKFLPPNGVIAEIGTAEGAFATQIFIHAKPSKLHLVDPWEYQPREDYQADGNNVGEEEFERRYKGNQEKFAPLIAAGKVELHRAYSPQAAELFPDSYFDYIYVDGMHTEDAVYADLKAFDRKVKSDGLIIGHDYVAHPDYRNMHFGVVEAVNRFVKETGYEFTLLTYEGSPTYVLSKSAESPKRAALLSTIMGSVQWVVEIDAPEDKILIQKDIPLGDGSKWRTIIGFR